MNTLEDVKKFHTVFNHPVLDTPQIPDEKRCKLRIALLSEELEELKTGIEQKDIVEIADAFCDLQYVLSGAILEFGLQGKFPSLFAEVQRSNMSKACETEEQAKATVDHYENQGVPAYYVHNTTDNLYMVYRVEDDKLLKSIDYSPANLRNILNDNL